MQKIKTTLANYSGKLVLFAIVLLCYSYLIMISWNNSISKLFLNINDINHVQSLWLILLITLLSGQSFISNLLKRKK